MRRIFTMFVISITYMEAAIFYICTHGAISSANATSTGGQECAGERKEGPTRLGWCLYRGGNFEAAAGAFRSSLAGNAGDTDATVGLAYASMQLGAVLEARASFRSVLAKEPDNGDARRGLALAALREPGEELRFRPDAVGTVLQVPARALRDTIELRRPDGSYAPIFVKGINLGAALPGKYPTEFPRDESVYASWLDTMAGMGANAVRLYTLLPPEFYAALAKRNAPSGSRKIWLIQGVWAELPAGNDFAARAYVDEFGDEIRRVIDAVHGDLVTPPRPGHASGIYDVDASGSLLAYIVGREWEPFAVKAFDASRPRGSFEGRYFRATDVPAMEAWVASMCELAAAYEARRFGTLHPLTFANWPTLDPLRHETEADRNEEDAWRAKYGIPFPEAFREAPWENDAVALDATKIVPTAAMGAGFFAAYHIYPNYPDFLNLEPRFASGSSRYASYLAALKRYHGHQPVLVAEFGMSTSRGVAHVQPEGWNHGGHDERRQGELVAAMIDAIRTTGYAGGVVFEYMDEWFKGTWSAAPLEIPAERRRLWFDAESPEQSYGLIANRPAAPVRLDGDPSDWRGAAYLRAKESRRASGGWGALRELAAASDEGYLYLALRTEGGPEGPDWTATSYRIAIDTYGPTRGATRLPPPGAATIATGVEFLVELKGPGASVVTVVAPYEPYAVIDFGPVFSPNVQDGPPPEFVHLTFESNRERIGRDGTRYPGIRVDRGALRFGSLDPASPGFDTRADVAVGRAAGTIELRLPWALLNVTDPSSRRVLHQTAGHTPPLDTTKTDGFRIYAFALDAARPERKPLSRLPVSGRPPLFIWEPWEQPRYRTEAKQGVPAIRKAWNAIPDGATDAP